MEESVKKLTAETIASISACKTVSELNDVRVKTLGKSGALTALLKGMKDVPPEKRPAAGKIVNDARETLEQAVSERQKALENEELLRKLNRSEERRVGKECL